MGLLDFLRGAPAIDKHAARVANRRAQAPDRWESIQYLAAHPSEASARALLARFAFRVDPSITDKDEKDAAFEGIVACGASALGPVREALGKAESIAWPLKALERLVDEDAVVAELLALLGSMDTEYERDPEKKIQVIANLERRRHVGIRPAVERFLGDANETVRFHAVATLFAQGEPDTALVDALLEALLREDSVRTRGRILDGFAAAQAAIPEPARSAVQARLPDGYALDAKSGALSKRG